MAEDHERPATRATAISGKANVSLICGLLSLFIPIMPSVLAIIFGAVALKDISHSRGRLKGQGLAIGGLVTGSTGLILAPLLLFFLILQPALEKANEAAIDSQSDQNMKVIGGAIQNYYATHGWFPPAAVYSPEGKPLYSWRVLVLPLLGEQQLYSRFKLDEAWDGPNNIRLLPRIPLCYVHPNPPSGTESYATCYQVFTGGGAMFDAGPEGRPRRFTEITDGTPNTIMLVEAAEPIPWSKPADLPYDPDQPLPRLGISSRGFRVATADGMVHFIPNTYNRQMLHALITYNGGEDVRVPWAKP